MGVPGPGGPAEPGGPCNDKIVQSINEDSKLPTFVEINIVIPLTP